MRTIATLLLMFITAFPAAAGEVKAVATFSIVADMVERVGGEHVTLTTLVGPDADAHVFDPSPLHARAVAQADIVFQNGLGFEPWMARILKSTKSKARVVSVADGVKARRIADDGHGHGTRDPHAWQDARNADIYVANIAQALSAADPVNAKTYAANAANYIAALHAMDAEIRAGFAAIPRERRRVITKHEAFGYFGAAYGITFIAPLGLSTDQQPSAKGLAHLIEQIKREKITAVFLENIADPRLIEQIARETGARIGGKLYSDALSTKAGGAPTYVAMMRHNARLLTEALRPGS